MGHVVAPELPEPGDGSWSHRARGGPGAALGLMAGAGATGHVAAPELPWAWWWELESRDTCVTPRVSNPHDYINHIFKRP
jgi:hypothetical protein